MTAGQRTLRRAVALAIRRLGDPREVLTVRRPPDDAELPNLWGLPAGRLRHDESWEDAVRRSGREKLGVRLDIDRELRRGTTERGEYALEMRLFEVTIAQGRPTVPQPYPEVTQYVDWRWARADALTPAAERGSLCSRLYLAVEAE